MAPSRPSKDRETNSSRVLANRYEIIKKLGSGNFGTAFLCKDLKNDDELKVLKEISVGDLQPDETVDAMHEARLLSKLDHPSIVKFHDSFIDGEFFCIITEYCEGGDLDHKITQCRKNKTSIDEKTVLDWLVQLVLAVHYMHSRRVLHRDLKTRNIFLKNNMIKIGDFGISRILMGTTDMASTFTGTPYYMSPEVLKHEGYNSKSDVWSIGCILFEVCALDHAFFGQSLMAVMFKIVEGDPPDLPSTYSKELNNVCKKMLVKDPDKRPSATEITKMHFIASHMGKMSQEYHAKQNNDQHKADQEADEIAKLLREKSHLEDLRRPEVTHTTTTTTTRKRQMTARERMRIRKLQEADQKAEKLKQHAKIQLIENKERTSAIKESLNKTTVPVWAFGKGEGERMKAALTLKADKSNGRRDQFDPYKSKVMAAGEDLSDYDDDEDIEFNTVIHRPARTSDTLSPYGANMDPSDRPITPMKNTMVYDFKNSSLDFKDGIPDQPELANTYYSQFDFDPDDEGSDEEGNAHKADGFGADDDEGTLVGADEEEEFINCLQGALDKSAGESTITLADDTISGAYGSTARDVKIKKLRAECEKILTPPVFEKAYAYLKTARFGKDGAGCSEKDIMQGLRKFVKNPSDCFPIDQLLFLEEQTKLS